MDRIQIINYIMSTPHNVNWNVLSTMLDEGDWSELKAYVEQTPHNMNKKVLEVLLGEEEPVSYRTVLYTDGTFIINESSKNQAVNKMLHGEVTNVYDPFDPNGDTDVKKYIFADMFQRPWNSQASSVKAVEIGSNVKPISTAFWFFGFSTCTSMNLDVLDTSAVTDMNNMFTSCQVLTTLDVTHFDTNAVTNMNGMFTSCHTLTTLDVTHFDTSAVTNMNGMFNECRALTTLDVSHFDTSAVTDMSSMFMSCQALTTLDVTHFDTNAVTKMNDMFYNCQALTTIYASLSFVVTQVTSSKTMFSHASNLVGGAGTAWNSNNPKDKTYAHIDGGTSNPGYFTAKV